MVMRDHHGRSSVRPVKQDIVSSLFQIPWAVICQPCFPANCKSVGINVRWCWQDEDVFFCSPHSMNLGLLFEDGTSSHFKNEAEQTLLPQQGLCSQALPHSRQSRPDGCQLGVPGASETMILTGRDLSKFHESITCTQLCSSSHYCMFRTSVASVNRFSGCVRIMVMEHGCKK